MQHTERVHDALKNFADSVTEKTSQPSAGAAEDQLRAPFEALMARVGEALAHTVVCKGESRLPGRLGTPDYAVHKEGLLTGYVELKAPGKGADPDDYSGHDRRQWERFQAMPNLLYSDGNEWALYRDGERVRRLVRLSGDVSTDGNAAVTRHDAAALLDLLTDFFSWTPIVPKDVQGLTGMLAPLCRMLRGDVMDALKDRNSPLVQLASDWRQLLFPDAPDEKFADSYAQTVTFALLLARSEGSTTLDLNAAQKTLSAEHSLLSRALQVFTDPSARAEIAASLRLLQRVINEVPEDALSGPRDPWLHFYEDFLATYDPALRRDAGAYYTPKEVVRAQVRLIDDLLTNRVGRRLGFAHPSVITLDPAVGTGTYPVGVIEHALKKVESEQGPGAVPAKATELGLNLNGFEIMVGPYAVAQLRLSRALLDHGGRLPREGPQVYLTDTLESPHATPSAGPLFHQPLSRQHKRALQVKARVPVLVCLGNPPYDRHPPAEEVSKQHAGGWVRWGESDQGPGTLGDGSDAILNDFVRPALEAGHGRHLKNLYNLYVYFWRWALWKVFEQKAATGPGVVSYISASSYIYGDAFAGMREHMRRLCDEIWILDLGGEGRGTRRDENVFNIQTPVAIALAARFGESDPDTPASVHYHRIDAATRERKLQILDGTSAVSDVDWEECPDRWQAPFRPAGRGAYFRWPLLTDLFPWQHSGCQFKRTWPIAPAKETLESRWQALLDADDRATAFKETRDRKVNRTCRPLLPGKERKPPIGELPPDTPLPPVSRYAYRSFDRQWAIADSRVGDFIRPVFWRSHGRQQVYVTSLFSQPLGPGPALTAAAHPPDLDHFRGSYGAKATIPLYRNRDATEPNLSPGLLQAIGDSLGHAITPADLLAYVYAIAAQPAFTRRFRDELETRELRIPITEEADLFERVRSTGQRLLWLHTYGERCVPEGEKRGRLPRGAARCTRPVPSEPEHYPENFDYNESTRTLIVGKGTFQPVAPEVYDFEVSGLKVVQSWLSYRMKSGSGRTSSPLDEIRPRRWTGRFTTELLDLLWTLQATIDQYPAQARLLEDVLDTPLIEQTALPPVPDAARRPPKRSRTSNIFQDQ